jgi:predicted nucleic acid-binding protein
MPLLLDTGPLYALADEGDSWHGRVRDFLEESRQPLLVPVSVLPEAAYLIRTRLGEPQELLFAESLAEGEITVEGLTRADLKRTAELMKKYPFLGFVDATVVAIGERLKLDAIVTTDRRDFRRVKPKHVSAFRLLA